jgi:hypothetical protein
VKCGCDEGYRSDGQGGCMLPDPCEPNPCVGAHRTRCQATNGAAVCSCEEGYWDLGECVRPNLASLIPVAECTRRPAA